MLKLDTCQKLFTEPLIQKETSQNSDDKIVVVTSSDAHIKLNNWIIHRTLKQDEV
jgi:hypothetical protein